ncbi:MAG: GIY-YIG nuclease family protein [Rhodospirillales bacterium]
MLNQIEGLCAICKSPVSVISIGAELYESCSECGGVPFTVKAYDGVLYVVSNPNQKGVKIGITKKPIEARLKSLSSTGVPGKFIAHAVFPSNKLKSDEKRVHEKLTRKRIEKEHFELEPLEAVLKCYRILNRRTPVFFEQEMRTKFQLQLLIDKNKMELRLLGKNS